ncbi:MAG: TlpA family protein disulfide reductase [Dysgonamonadaceae bacterium]|jgi:peroxiredoxin|nr:TlpA family protein disulfide reductase [Dysgonamonadaceae bacterium]
MKKIVFVFILLMGGMSFCFSQNAVPSVKLKNLKGTTVNTSELSNNGNPIIISFFSLWCKQCIKELNDIHSVYNEWQEDTGVKLIAVSIDDSENSDKVKSTINANRWKYDVLLDSDGKLKQALSVNLIPAVFVIDGNGTIVYSRTGYEEEGEKQLIKEVRKLAKKE